MKAARAILTLVVLTALLAIASTASAAVTIGQTSCPANKVVGGPTLLLQTGVASEAGYTVPGDGILTSWSMDRSGVTNLGVASAILASGSGHDWTIAAATPFEYIYGNTSAQFPVRIPVRAGQILGTMTYSSFPLMCLTSKAGDTIESIGSIQPVGAGFTTSTFTADRVNVAGTIEPDADNDGYGDDTQDKCPQSAAFQNTCPVLTISQSLSRVANNIYVRAASSYTTPLTASVSVKVPKLGKKKATTVTFKSPATTVAAGALKQLKLKFPTRLAQARAALAKGKKLKATVTLSGAGLANSASVTGSIWITR